MSNSTNIFASLCALGLSVFPVRRGMKVPVGKWTEYQNRLATPEEIAVWDAGDYNVGVVCGNVSNLFVVDVDSEEGQALYDSFTPPLTPTVRTSKGRHFYFRYPRGLRNRVRIGDVPLDARGEGGFVVGPGSLHPSGEIYEWELSPDDVAFADLPSDLLMLFSAPASGVVRSSAVAARAGGQIPANRFSDWIDKKLDEGLVHLRGAKEGQRNDTLNNVAFVLASCVSAAKLDWDPFAAELSKAAQAIGLSVTEADATIESAWRGGNEHPAAWIKTAQEWAYVGTGDRFCLMDGSRCLKPSAFNTMHNSERQWEKGSISTFLTSQNLIEKVIDFRFDPARPSGSYLHNDQLWLNTYCDPGIVAVDGDPLPFADFIEYLVPNEAERYHLLRMIAWTVRYPHRKLGHALLFRSEKQGVGKSTLVEIWRALLGVDNTRLTTTEEINGPYQGFIDGKLLILVEELNMAFGAQGYNRIKNLITGATAEVNEKFVASREMPNYASFVFLTNLPNPVLIEDTDRRFFFISSSASPRDPTYYNTFNDWWRKNLGVIRHFIDGIDLSDFNPFAPPPDTEAKRQLRAASLSPVEQELMEALAERRWPFSRDVVRLEEVRQSLGSIWHGQSLARIQNALIAIGAVSLGQQRVSGSWTTSGGRELFIPEAGIRVSLWAVTNVDYWGRAGSEARAAEYARRNGLFREFDGTGIAIRHASQNESLFRELCLTD